MSANPPDKTDEDRMRANFEKWFHATYRIQVGEGGGGFVDDRWQCWQSAAAHYRAAALEEAAQMCINEAGNRYDSTEIDTLRTLAEEIRAAAKEG